MGWLVVQRSCGAQEFVYHVTCLAQLSLPSRQDEEGPAPLDQAPGEHSGYRTEHSGYRTKQVYVSDSSYVAKCKGPIKAARP